MRKWIWFLFLFTLIAFPSEAKQINVLTTTADLKSIAEYIGGDKISVDSLGIGTQNYHFLSAKPSYMVKAKKADLFIRVGLELEIGYEPLVLEGARNRDIQIGRIGHLDASEGIIPMDIPKEVDRSMGDIHASGNPHYWLDPLNAKIVAKNITERLTQIEPENASYFWQRLENFNQKIDQKTQEWMKRLSPYKGEKLITYHQTWNYFAKRFGFEIIGQLEPKPGIPPTPGHLRDIIKLIEDTDVKIILNENIYKTNAAQFVAEKTQAKVVVAPVSVGGDKQSEDYFSLINTIVRQIEEGFQQ